MRTAPAQYPVETPLYREDHLRRNIDSPLPMDWNQGLPWAPRLWRFELELAAGVGGRAPRALQSSQEGWPQNRNIHKIDPVEAGSCGRAPRALQSSQEGWPQNRNIHKIDPVVELLCSESNCEMLVACCPSCRQGPLATCSEFETHLGSHNRRWPQAQYRDVNCHFYKLLVPLVSREGTLVAGCVCASWRVACIASRDRAPCSGRHTQCKQTELQLAL